MKRGILSYLFLPLLLSVPVRSQTGFPLFIGLVGERSFGPVGGTALIYSDCPDYGLLASGSISSMGFGAVLTVPNLFSSQLGLTLRPVWKSSVVSLTAEKTIWASNGAGDATETEHEFRVETSSQTLSVALLGTYQVVRQITLGLGPEIGYRFRQNVLQTDRILGPGEIAFTDGQTLRAMDDGPIYSSRPLSFGLVASGSVTVPIGSRFSFLIEATATADLLSPVREAEWRGLAFGGRVGLVFDLEKAKRPPPQFPEIMEPVAPPAPLLSLSASIDIYGLEGETRKDTITSRFREKEYCRDVRFVPEIVFEKGSVELPQIYARAEVSSEFPLTLDSLAALDPFALQERSLDVIGLRLRNNPGSPITLRAAGTEVELVERRLEQVRDYLLRIWELEPERVMIEKAPAGPLSAGVHGEGNTERVIVESSSSGILNSIVSRRLDRDFEAPLVKVATSHQADAGLRSWEVILTSRNETIARYSSGGQRGKGPESMNWDMVYDEGTLDSSIITALFTVEDSTGNRRTVRSEAPLKMFRSRIGVAHVIDMSEMTEAILYRLPNSGGGAIDSLGHEDVLREVDRTLSDGASVWIAGGPRMLPLRDSLTALLQRHGVQDIREVSQEELMEQTIEAGGCVDAGASSDAGFFLLVKQGIAK